ncbi:MAG: tetratricopeptide repeat protein [Sandaracinaceae bacterium]|nr:tetratricopeptide repeat protein [Sandaracinaceae bacterium]
MRSDPPTRLRHPIPKAPLVGRDRELGELEGALARAVASRNAQTVTIVGGAGIGKGRLVEEFLAQTAERDPKTRSFRGQVLKGGPMLGAVQRILRARFGIADAADPEYARERLREQVAELLDDRRVTEFLHFLGAYLDIRFPESPFTRALEGDAEQLARISRAVFRTFLEADAKNGPMILTFEQLENAHDEVLDLIQYLGDSLTDAPVLLVAAARPELLTRRPRWGSGSRHHRIELTPLDAEHAGAMVRALLAPTGSPPDDLVDAAVETAGGSPYLLEQMVRTFLDTETLMPREDGSWEVDLDRLEDAELPLSVDDAIAARISSMTPPERELLERAASMGSVFWLGALVALGRLDEDAPDLWGGAERSAAHYRDLLGQLEERDYVMRFDDSSLHGEEEYAFKHNLERDALHRLTNATGAERYHRRVAEWLEFRLYERGEEAFELLASHYEQGGAGVHAASYYLLVGDRARERYANAKAAEYYGRGLELLGDQDLVRRIDALHNYGDVLQLLGRNEEAIEAFRGMHLLAYRLDLKSKGGAAHNRIGRVYRAIGNLEEAMRHLGTGHALFDAVGDARGVASSLDDVGKVHWMRGAYEAAERFSQRSLEIRREIGDRRSIALSLNNLGLVYQDSGRFDEALAAFGEALSIRREIGDAPGMAQTLNNLGTIHQDNGNHAQAASLWNEALDYARRVGDRMREAVILTNLGESSYRQSQAAEAIAILSKAEEISATLGDRILEAEILRGLAKAHLLLQDHPTAKGYIERSVALFESARSKPFLGVALRTLAEVHAASGEEEAWRDAEQAYRHSQALFEELGNEVELARTCISFAEFLEGVWKGSDPERARLARDLRDRALEIHGKQLASETYALPRLEGEQTNPGIELPD